MYEDILSLAKIPSRGLGDRVIEVINGLSEEEPELGDLRSLGPMMSKPLKASTYAHMKFLTRNLNDTEYFRISGAILKSLTNMLSDLLNGGNVFGLPTYGGSESNLTALYIARELGYRYVIVPRSAHYSVFKSCRILGLKPVITDVNNDLRALPDSILKALKNYKKAVIVLTAGNTETGVIDHVKKVSELAPNNPIVVDAAFGGLIAPFIDNDLPIFDFRVDNVVAIGVDGHKAGLSPIPSGMLLVRGEEAYEKVVFRSMYLPCMKQVGLLWTRTAASVASLWASLLYLGKDGFRKIYSTCLSLARKLRSELLEAGFNPTQPELPIICIRHRRIKGEVLLKELRKLGWYVYLCPSLNGVKVTIMPHISEDVISTFIEDLKAIAKKLT